MKKTLKVSLCLLLSLAMMLSLVACGGNEEEPSKEAPTLSSSLANLDESTYDASKKYKEHVNLSVWAAVTSLDAQVTSVTGAFVIHNLFSNQLFVLNESTGELEPELAEKYETIDSQTYKIYLKKGIPFHNGEELKAVDVKYSLFDRLTVPSTKIKEIEIVDDYTVVFHLLYPNSEFMYDLYGCSSTIVNKKACEADPEKGVWIGTGGYKVTDWQAADKCELEKYPDSFVWKEEGDTPTKTLTIKCMTSGTVEAVQAGDVANALASMEEIEGVLASDPNVETDLAPTWGWWRYSINHAGDSIFVDDPELLKAVVAAIDREELAWFYAGDLARVPDSYFPDYMTGYTNKYEYAKFDLEASKAHLAKSKHPDGKFTIRIMTLTQGGYADKVQALAAQLENNIPGCKCEITQYDSATCKANAATMMGYEFYLSDVTGATIGSKWKGQFDFTKNEDGTYKPGSANYANYFNQEVVDLYNDYLATADTDKQLADLARIQEIICEDMPYLAYAYMVTGVCWHKGVSGLNWKSSTHFDFHRVAWEEEA